MGLAKLVKMSEDALNLEALEEAGRLLLEETERLTVL